MGKPGNFHDMFDKYAEIAVKIGVNVQKNQQLIIEAPIDAKRPMKQVQNRFMSTTVMRH